MTKALETWNKLQIGLLPLVRSLRQAMQDDGFRITQYANKILDKLTLSTNGLLVELDLVVVTQADLGFARGTTFENMIARAKECGLEMCPAEVGPYLRLVYKDQPTREWLRIAMEPIFSSESGPHVFKVICDSNGLWLDVDWFNLQAILYPGDHWVFVRSSK